MNAVNPMPHENTNAIITGGSQGLGYAIAERLAQEGARNIVIAGRDRQKGEKAAAELSRLGTSCFFVPANLEDIAQCGNLFSTALDKCGTINALVNAAADTSRGGLLDATPELLDRQMHINVRAPMLLMQSLVKDLLVKDRPGSIVNILSLTALCGQSYLTSYSATKGALATMTKNVANSFAANRIRCNGIMTGWMDTPGEDLIQREYYGAGPDWLEKAEASLPMKQLVKPRQVAGLASYMLSPGSGVMTGALVEYDQFVMGAYPQ